MPNRITDPALLAQLEDSGPQPVTDPALLAQLDAPEQTFGDKVAAIPGRIASAAQGNAAEEAPDVYSPEFSTAIGGRGESGAQRTMTQLIPGANMVQLGMQMVDLMHPNTAPAVAQQAELERDLAAGTGNDEDVKQRLLRTVPGLTETQDANGNPMLVKDGKRFYVNQPGLDVNDASRLAQKAAGFIPAGKAAGVTSNALGRIGLGALAAGATQGAMDLTASEGKRLDPKDVALAALFGGGAEAAAPIIKAVWGKLSGAFKGDPTNAGKALAAQLGVEGQLSDDAYRAIAARADEIHAGMKPEAAIAEAEFGIPLTRGQKTGNFDQLAAEERIAAEGGTAGHTMRGANEAQRDAVGSARGNLGAELPESAAAGMQKLQGALREEHSALKGATEEAYAGVNMDKTTVQASALNDLPQRLRGVAKGLNPTRTPQAKALLEDLQGITDGFANAGAKEVKLRALEDGRQIINDAIGATVNRVDRAAAMRIKGEYDKWLGETMDTAIVQGDAATLESLKTARGLRAELARRFESKDGAGKLVAAAIKQGKSADGLADTLLGASQVSKGSGDEVAAAIKSALGKNQEGWDALRGTVLLRATTDKTGQVLGATKMQANLRQLLKERPDLMKTLFPEELPKIRRFTEALSTMVKPEGLKRSSGTGERIWNYVTSVPGLSWLRGPSSIAQAHAATKPLATPGPRLLGAGAGGDAYSNQ